jgi:hypothetical protein
VNPEGLGTRLYSWVDANGDGQFQTGENTSLLKVSGSPYTTLASGLKNPRTAEVTLGLTQGGLRGLTFNLFGFRRFDQQLMSLVNVGVPFSSYTPVQVTDPGPDGFLDAGGDDQVITVFNQKPESLGRDRYLLSNPEGLDGYSEGYELRLAFSSARFQVEAAMTRYRAVASTAPGITARDNDTSALQSVLDDPNKAIFARGSTYFDRGTLGRLWATSSPGWDIRCSLIVSYQDGLPYSRYLPVKGLNQGIVGVLTRPRGPGDAGSIGGFMTTHNGTIDVRTAKDLRRGSKTLTATLDVFNLANSSLSLVQTDVTAPTHLWRIPLRFQTPRSLQLGLRFRW